jgi:hypothetical protein
MLDGLRNATIAKHLLSVDADHHACAILAEFGVTSHTDAIEIARRDSQKQRLDAQAVAPSRHLT